MIWEAYKGSKKIFRKLCRVKLNDLNRQHFDDMAGLFRRTSFSGHKEFWNRISEKKRKLHPAHPSVRDFTRYYAGIMQDDDECDERHRIVAQQVRDWCESAKESPANETSMTPESVAKAIDALKRGTAPGVDGVSPEHLLHGKSDVLLHHLATFFRAIVTACVVPDMFSTGVIVPIVKKPTLDPALPENYRPLTLCSVITKVFESMIMPQYKAAPSQFGFLRGRSCDMACSLLNDCLEYARSHGMPLFVCTLDAAKCFDRLWHDGIFFKLHDVLPERVWYFCYLWYKSMNARVRLNGVLGEHFAVSRGSRQGSTLSPAYFNVFINDLLTALQTCESGLRFDSDTKVNHIAYADDLTLLSPTRQGMQKLLDICHAYSEEWRFAYNPNKSHTMLTGRHRFGSPRPLCMGNTPIPMSDSIEVLGCVFSNNGLFHDHAEAKTSKCQRQYYALQGHGLSPNGLPASTKSFVWNTACQPILTYCLGALNLDKRSLAKLDSTQGTLVKRFNGLPKHCHHSRLLRVLDISKCEFISQKQSLNLYYRILNSDSIAFSVLLQQLSMYLSTRHYTKGSLLHRVILTNVNPLQACFKRPVFKDIFPAEDGIADSILFLFQQNDLILPHTTLHDMLYSLTTAF